MVTAILSHQEEELDVFDEVEEISPGYEEQVKVTTVAIDKFVNGELWRK